MCSPPWGAYGRICALHASMMILRLSCASCAAWDVLAENLLDPSHLNFSHHATIGTRCTLAFCFCSMLCT